MSEEQFIVYRSKCEAKWSMITFSIEGLSVRNLSYLVVGMSLVSSLAALIGRIRDDVDLPFVGVHAGLPLNAVVASVLRPLWPIPKPGAPY